MKITTIKLEDELVKRGKKVVRNHGLQWKYYLEKVVEKHINDIIENDIIDKTII